MHQLEERRFGWWLLAITGLALSLRVLVVLTWSDRFIADWPVPFGGDGIDYLAVAKNIAESREFVGYDGLESGRPPLWPLVLSFPVRLTDSVLLLQLFASLLGAAVVGVTGLAGRKLGGARVGLVAAALAAVHPGYWLLEWPLLGEPLLLLGLGLFVWASYSYIERPTVVLVLALGVLVGGLVLIRPEQILLAPLVVLPLVLRTPEVDFRARILRLSASAVVAALVLVPWTAVNQTRFEEPVLSSTTAGQTLLVGNCESTYSGERLGYWDIACAAAPAMRGEIPPGDSSETDLAYRRLALDFMGQNVSRLPVVIAARVGRTFGVYQPGWTSRDWSGYMNLPLWAVHAWFISFFLLAPLAVVGTVRLRRGRVPVYPLLAPLVLVLVTTASTLGEPRYRAGGEVSLVLLSSVCLAWMWRRARSTTSASADRTGLADHSRAHDTVA